MRIDRTFFSPLPVWLAAALALVAAPAAAQSSGGAIPSAASIDEGLSASGAGLVRGGAGIGATVIGRRARELSRLQAGGGGMVGLSAGGAPARWGVWADLSGGYIANDAAGKAYEGGGPTFLSGFDATIGDAWVVGFSAGYSHTALNVNVFDGNRVTEGAIVGPYASYVISDHLTLDGNLTYTRLSNDFTAGAGSSVRGSFNADRLAAAANLNYFGALGALSFVGSAGYAYTYQHADSFLDSATRAFGTSINRLGAIKLALELSHPMGAFEPYLPLGYEYDTTRAQDGSGRSAVLVGVGLRYHPSDTLSAGLVATTEALRAHQRDATVAGNLRYSF